MPYISLLFLVVLFFLSGVASLLYQVMWMKELSLLFGSSTQSAAITTASFFLGLGLGAQLIGKWVKQAKQNTSHQRRFLGYYFWLEIAIAISALLYFLLYPAFNLVYAGIFDYLTGQTNLLLAIKFLLAMVLLSIPAFFMGGTLPVMAELVVDKQSKFASRVAHIYFVNTLGACAGAIAGGFWLPKTFGFTNTYLIAIAISSSLALIVWLYRWRAHPADKSHLQNSVSTARSNDRKRLSKTPSLPKYLLLVAAFSGFASLALQVLWTRLFSQVLQNSTYTYSAIITVFLLALTLGALIASRLARLNPSIKILSFTLLISALLVALTPASFMYFTNGMSYVGGRVGLMGYIFEVIGIVAIVIGPSVVVMGITLPYLYKLVESQIGDSYANIVGRINSLNTYAAIVGSLLAGFVLFHWLGTWQAIYAIASLYMVTAFLVIIKIKVSSREITSFALIAIFIIVLNPGKLPIVPISPITKKERLLEVWEGSSGTVAVVEQDGNLKTKLNNWYALGGSKAKRMEAMQTHLPLQLHGQAKSVFYLGLGTGITAGTVLNYTVDKVVVAELIDKVITASEKYFTEFNNDLFNDPRVSVVNEDGRHYLHASSETFDLIIADLFIPWRAGVGSLYSLEHFLTAKKRLNDHGYFVQWLPMYQMTVAEFKVIAKTMLEAFPMVTAWRGDFFANKPIVALVGHQHQGLLKDQTFLRQSSARALQSYEETSSVPLLSHYIGQLHADLPFLQGARTNTDDNPIIDYLAPASHRAEKQGLIDWLTGPDLLAVMRQIQTPEDTFLEGMSEREVRAIFAGYFLQVAQVARDVGDEQARKKAMEQVNQLLGSR